MNWYDLDKIVQYKEREGPKETLEHSSFQRGRKEGQPLAIIGRDGEYPWGGSRIYTPEHSDFLLLRDRLLRVHASTLSRETEVKFEDFRQMRAEEEEAKKQHQAEEERAARQRRADEESKNWRSRVLQIGFIGAILALVLTGMAASGWFSSRQKEDHCSHFNPNLQDAQLVAGLSPMNLFFKSGPGRQPDIWSAPWCHDHVFEIEVSVEHGKLLLDPDRGCGKLPCQDVAQVVNHGSCIADLH